MRSILLLLAIAIIAIANATKLAEVIPGRFIVEFSLTTKDVKRTGDDFLARLQEGFPDINFSVTRMFNHKFMKAMTIQIDDAVAARRHHRVYRFAANAGVIDKVHPVYLLSRPQAAVSGSPSPSTRNAQNARRLLPHDLTQVDRIHREFNNTGQGVVIGIIDSGMSIYYAELANQTLTLYT